MSTSKRSALLIGINYPGTSAALRGCHNDVRNMIQFLQEKLGFQSSEIKSFMDDTPVNAGGTTAMGIIHQLHLLAAASWRDELDLVFFHYSGHGASIRDYSGDERDGKDECLVPSDYARAGLITDDILSAIFRSFRPQTRVVCILDACHSSTALDLPFQFKNRTEVIKHEKALSFPCKVLTLSGTTDDSTSADAYNVRHRSQFSGAMSSCFLLCWEDKCKTDIFFLLEKVQRMLREKRFQQVPQVCASYDLQADPTFFP